MKKVLGITILILLVTAAVFATAAKSAPDTITLDDCKAKKSAVTFPHKAHFDTAKIACDTCHHTQKGLQAGAATEVQTCTSCHLEPEKATTPKCAEMSTKKNPYHLVCVDCHKQEKAKKADTKAPTGCNDCHPK